MKEMEWRFEDKSTWGDGPWQDEPDKKQWTDAATGLPCLIHRGPLGHLCGYVGVSRAHPWYGLHYDSVDVDVHGGLTYANKCQPTENEGGGICHTVGEGEDDDVWWFGFDCAHLDDLIPARDRRFGYSEHEVYRDVPYVERECASLANQLAAVQR